MYTIRYYLLFVDRKQMCMHSIDSMCIKRNVPNSSAYAFCAIVHFHMRTWFLCRHSVHLVSLTEEQNNIKGMNGEYFVFCILSLNLEARKRKQITTILAKIQPQFFNFRILFCSYFTVIFASSNSYVHWITMNRWPLLCSSELPSLKLAANQSERISPYCLHALFALRVNYIMLI